MTRCRLLRLALAATLAIAVGGTCARAAGVAVVTQTGGESFGDAKNGFLQVAYGSQMPGLVGKPFEVSGADGDEETLQSLKEQDPSVVFAIGPKAAREARKALPEAWIVYALVYFPRTAGFLDDPKMVGVTSLGPARELGTVLKALVGKPKSLVVVHDASVSADVPELLSDLKSRSGVEARGLSVEGPSALAGAVADLKGQTQAIVFLPDPATADAEAFRAAVAQCVSAGIPPVSLTEGLVANGALCGALYPAEEIGAKAAALAGDLLQGRVPESKAVVPDKTATSCNRATAEGLRVKFPKDFRPETTYE